MVEHFEHSLGSRHCDRMVERRHEIFDYHRDRIDERRREQQSPTMSNRLHHAQRNSCDGKQDSYPMRDRIEDLFT